MEIDNKRKRVSYWKGKTFSEEYKKKLSLAHLGKTFSEEHKKKISLSHLGKTFSEKHKNNLGLSISKAKFNKPLAEETKRKISLSLRGKNIGENGSNWQGGKSYLGNVQNKKCNKVGGPLHAHHIKSFAFYPDERYDLNNGKTLCINCHKETESYLVNYNTIKKEVK